MSKSQFLTSLAFPPQPSNPLQNDTIQNPIPHFPHIFSGSKQHGPELDHPKQQQKWQKPREENPKKENFHTAPGRENWKPKHNIGKQECKHKNVSNAAEIRESRAEKMGGSAGAELGVQSKTSPHRSCWQPLKWDSWVVRWERIATALVYVLFVWSSEKRERCERYIWNGPFSGGGVIARKAPDHDIDRETNSHRNCSPKFLHPFPLLTELPSPFLTISLLQPTFYCLFNTNHAPILSWPCFFINLISLSFPLYFP